MTNLKFYVYYRGLVWGGFDSEEIARRFAANRWFRGFKDYKVFKSRTGAIPDCLRDNIELGQSVQIVSRKIGEASSEVGEVVSTKDYPICQVRLPGRKYFVCIHADRLVRISTLEPITPVKRPEKEGF